MLSLFSPTVSSISNNLILFTTLKLIIYIYIYWWVFFFFFRNISVETNLNVGKKLKKYIKKLYLTVILLDLLLLRHGSCSLESHLIHDKININIIMLFRHRITYTRIHRCKPHTHLIHSLDPSQLSTVQGQI